MAVSGRRLNPFNPNGLTAMLEAMTTLLQIITLSALGVALAFAALGCAYTYLTFRLHGED